MALADVPYEMVVVEQFERVVRLTLNRPDKRNAICSTLQREVIDVVERSADDPTAHVVIIRGAGPSFCAGYDVTPASVSTTEAPSVPRRAIGTLKLGRGWSRIWDAHIPVIAQIHGHCLAGGTDLAQHCDLILTADDATIGFPAIRMGGTPPTNMWLYNVGPQWAKRLLLTGDTFTGRFAANIGFALEAIPAAELDDYVMALARRIAAVGRDIVAINKFVINKGLGLMGRDTLQELAAPLDAIANQAAEMAEFNARAQEVGIASAFKERDAPFRSGVPLDTPDS
jgi:enoyl-CoA hydratase